MLNDLWNPYWYSFVLGLAGRLRHPQSAATLSACRTGVELHYRLLGGDASFRVSPGLDASAAARPSTNSGMDLMAWLERERIHLPRVMNRYPDAESNRTLYYWLAAFLAADTPTVVNKNLARGVRHLADGVITSYALLDRFPGLEPRYLRLCDAELRLRESLLPGLGMSASRVHLLEKAFRFALGGQRYSEDDWLTTIVRRQTPMATRLELLAKPPSDWLVKDTPFLPVPLWRRPDSPTTRFGFNPLLKLPRSVKLNAGSRGFESSVTGTRSRRSVHRESQQTGLFYSEWDHAANAYRHNWCRIVESESDCDSPSAFATDNAALVQATRRQFEALGIPQRWRTRATVGDEIDIDAYVEAIADQKSRGVLTERLFRHQSLVARDLAVLLLIDTSRSMRAKVGDDSVLEIARQSASVLAHALAAIGDQLAIYGFSSESRLRVNVKVVKRFDDHKRQAVERRLGALKPAHYTRMGAAIRHAGQILDKTAATQKLLLVLTDGRPSDPIDGYEGDYAIEDCRYALKELRERQAYCFGLAIDRFDDSGGIDRDELARLFGTRRVARITNVARLPVVLPRLFAHLTGLAA